MSNKMINTIMFATGAVIGSLVTWKYVKTKYERIAQEEIDSVIEEFRKQAKNNILKTHAKEEHNELENTETETETDEYIDIASRYSSISYVSDTENEQKGGGTNMPKKPYIISPDDFGDLDGYETSTLTYYADGVLENDYYIVIDAEEVDNMVGTDSFNHFGDHENDTVYVRNEKLKTDFEIQRDLRQYSEINHLSLRNDE